MDRKNPWTTFRSGPRCSSSAKTVRRAVVPTPRPGESFAYILGIKPFSAKQTFGRIVGFSALLTYTALLTVYTMCQAIPG